MPQEHEPALLDAFADRPFVALVEHYMDTESKESCLKRFLQITKKLPPGSEKVAARFVDRWNTEALSKPFWQTQTAHLHAAIVEDARNLLQANAIRHDDNDLEQMFNVIVLGFAHYAHGSTKVRVFMGLPGPRFSWPSALSLLLPVFIAWYALKFAGAIGAMGYGLAGLGALMSGAGLFTGTFLIFKLRDRRRVFLCAAAALALGAVLVRAGA